MFFFMIDWDVGVLGVKDVFLNEEKYILRFGVWVGVFR